MSSGLRTCDRVLRHFGQKRDGDAYAVARCMPSSSRPYEIKARVFMFACEVVRTFPRTRLDVPSTKVWSQLIASATSAGAHLEEAAAAGSRAHFLSLTRGALREMREANYWLRVLTRTQLTGFKEAEPLVDESNQLTAILATIVRRSFENGRKE